MAEFTGPDLRVNELVDSLTTLRVAAVDKFAAIPPRKGFATAPNGQVLDRAGNVIYRPTPVKQERAT